MRNLDEKMRWCQNWPGILLLSSISIVYKQREDSNNKNRDLKVKIYHLALKIILKYM